GLALVDLAMRPDRRGIAAVIGGAQVIGGGGYRDARFDAIDLAVGLDGGIVSAVARAAAPGRTALRVEGTAVLGAHGGPGEIELRRGSLVLRSDDVGQAGRGLVPARGALEIDLVAYGRIASGQPTT